MNVLFLTHRLPYAPNRGDRIRAYHLLQEMSRFSDVSLFSLVHDAGEAAHAGSVPFARTVVTAAVSRIRNLARGGLRLAGRTPLTHALLDAPGATAALGRMADAHPPDVVVAYCSGMARFSMQAPLDRFPFVLDMVDVDSAKWRQMASDASGPKRWIYAREAATLASFEAAAVQRARTTLVVNDREAGLLRAIAPDGRIRVVPNGIDVSAFRPATTASERLPHVIFCGVLDYGPNEAGVLWFLKNVWPLVAAARPDARFAIVGANPTRALQQAAAGAASVDLVGAVPAVQPYLWKASVSVAPLHLARGLQNKVLEAIAAGLPVVATSVVIDGIPEAARPGCLVADDPEAFARSVLALLDETPAGRADRLERADLATLGWRQRLGDLSGILGTAAA